MHEELAKIKEHARFAIDQAVTPDALEKVRLQYFGRRNGALTAILRALKDLPEDIRKEIGQNANRLRRDIETWLDEKATEIQKTYRESVLEREWLDVTRPGVKKIRGSLHPITLLIREVLDIFRTLGFIAVDGPEVETEYYNFDALNIPADHPARDMWDTFWLDSQFKISDSKKPSDRLLLRTHTSPVQVRYMEAHNPPLRIVVPGRVYRYEATDASHDIQFHQLEGLVVDRDVSIAHAKAIIQLFFSRLFKTDIAIRLRPSYFPFTEPSF
ncbi:MAG: phenylalanyl-tRNA synthetase, alpha subunit, partial [Parcubacteria group bacterium Gr01-1014_66]